MRVRIIWLAWLLTAGVALAPGAARAQTEDGAIPSVITPLPLFHNHPAKGGFFTTGSFVMYRQTNPLEHQPIAFRGFFDVTGELTGNQGQFVGSAALALDAKDAGGPGTYQPGLKVGIGYRFQDGLSVELNWMHLADARYQRVATIIPPLFKFGPQNADSFLTAPVFNFPNDYAGPANKVEIARPGEVYGIWNGASLMQIDFTQRTEQVELAFRKPVFETECWRSYALAGPRFFWIWEKFRWRTVSQDFRGQAEPTDVAIYTNIVSNRLYGAYLGLGNEWYLGYGVAFSLDLEAAAYLDIVKERAKYELGARDAGGQHKRAKVDYTIVPEGRGTATLWWYPTEGIQLRLGYDLMAFFNTVAAPHPVSFDWGALDPAWEKRARVFDGIQAGVAFIF